ncbi:MAG: hypothetical protein ACRDTP_10570 [Mycobacteriales bacterium]
MAGQTRTKVTHRRVRVPGRPVHPTSIHRLRARPVLLALCLAGSAASLTACGHGPSDATTVLRGATGVTVVSAAGVPHPGAEGEHLTVGETVRTTRTDTALVTGRRVTTLGPSTALDIADRSHYLLDAGTIVVDHRHGPDARVDAGPVTVEHIGATSVRIERGFAVRVAAFDGGAATVSASERSTLVPALHEIDVPGASLPSSPTPLALRDDALDTVAAPALVAGDQSLDHRAAALDLAGGSMVPAALIRSLPAALTSTTMSERVLPVAIARADRKAPLAGAYARATELRAEGGSWGVIAALMGANIGAVQQQLDELLANAPAALTLPATATGDSGASAVTALLSAAAPATAAPTPAAPTPAATAVAAASAPPSGGGSSPAPGRSPSPTPTPTPLVQTLINTVTGLLPHGGAGAPAAPSRPAHGPSPAPTASGGLLGGVLGSLLGAR